MCRVLGVSRQGYYKYVESLNKPPKHAELLAAIRAIIEEDEFNDKYGRERIYDTLVLRGWDISPSTVYRVCRDNGILNKPNKPKGLTKQEKEAYKNDDLLKGNFLADGPNQKLISDITQLPTKDGTLYISLVFDCFDAACVGLAMSDNMKTDLTIASAKMAAANAKTSQNAAIAAIAAPIPTKTPIIHTDRGSQYTSTAFRAFAQKHGITQSMSYAGSGYHGNARCESLIARFKVEAIYNRYDTKNMPMEEVKSLVFRYFMGYWNNRRINHAIGGMPPLLKRARFYEEQNRRKQKSYQSKKMAA